MKSFRFVFHLVVSTVGFLLVATFLCASAAAQGDDRATSSKRRYRPISSDIRKAMSQIARRYVRSADTLAAGAQLDVFEIELRERLEGRTKPDEIVATIARYFFTEQKFESDEDLTDPDNFYVHEVLLRKQGYCLSLSAIILAVGRRLKLPLHGVAAPRHFFVRYDDGKTRINIETTEDGKRRSDAFYRRRGITSAAERDGVFLRNLSDAEVVAYLLNNEGYVHWHAGRADVAKARFQEALRRHPKLVEAMINLGVVAGDRGETSDAKAQFDKVLEWMPNDTATHLNRSLSAMRAGRFREAIAALESAAGSDPTNARVNGFRHILLTTLLRPDNWRRYQKSLVAESEALRRTKTLRSGLAGIYFADRDLKKVAARRIDREIKFQWRWNRPHRSVPADDFSARWEGYVDIPSRGTWSFFTVANDGVRLWVDGVRIIDNWKRNEGALDRENLELEKGLHPIRLEYFEINRFAGIELRVKRADQDRQLSARHFLHSAR